MLIMKSGRITAIVVGTKITKALLLVKERLCRSWYSAKLQSCDKRNWMKA